MDVLRSQLGAPLSAHLTLGSLIPGRWLFSVASFLVPFVFVETPPSSASAFC